MIPDVAEFHELEKLGIQRIIDLGKNAFGFNEKIIVLNCGARYEYIPEDNLYILQQE